MFLVFLLLCSVLERSRKVLPVLLLFVLFSGMDGWMAFVQNNWSDHLEWWAVHWQYSSNSTCLFWVFNQAVPAWLAALLLLHSLDEEASFGLLGSVTAIFSPLPLMGLAFLCLGIWLKNIATQKEKSLKERLLKPFSPVNIPALLGAVPIVLYLASNRSASGEYPHFEMMGDFFSSYLPFILIEWGIYALLMARYYRKDPMFYLMAFSLFIIPMITMGGYTNDFPMRVSIPALVMLMVYCGHFIQKAGTEQGPGKTAVLLLVACLTIGALTPLTEFKRGIEQTRYMTNHQMSYFRDDYGTVLGKGSHVRNFICEDTEKSFFYKYMAIPAEAKEENK